MNEHDANGKDSLRVVDPRSDSPDNERPPEMNNPIQYQSSAGQWNNWPMDVPVRQAS